MYVCMYMYVCHVQLLQAPALRHTSEQNQKRKANPDIRACPVGESLNADIHGHPMGQVSKHAALNSLPDTQV